MPAVLHQHHPSPVRSASQGAGRGSARGPCVRMGRSQLFDESSVPRRAAGTPVRATAVRFRFWKCAGGAADGTVPARREKTRARRDLPACLRTACRAYVRAVPSLVRCCVGVGRRRARPRPTRRGEASARDDGDSATGGFALPCVALRRPGPAQCIHLNGRRTRPLPGAAAGAWWWSVKAMAAAFASSDRLHTPAAAAAAAAAG